MKTNEILERIGDRAFLNKIYQFAYLLNEYKSYNLLIAGINIQNDFIEKCIAENILSEPQKRIGAEGVLLVVENSPDSLQA